MTQDTETLIVAGGCFWCVEAVFASLAGVVEVESGYAGGHEANPSYEEVCSGSTGHAEAVRIRFDPAVLSCAELLDVFFGMHDPTQLNRQGNDIGPQYRSAVFPLTAAQEKEARAAIRRAGERLPRPVVTTIEPAGPWYPAASDHQGYYRRVGAANPYCTFVIEPKLRKLGERYGHLLRPGGGSAA